MKTPQRGDLYTCSHGATAEVLEMKPTGEIWFTDSRRGPRYRCMWGLNRFIAHFAPMEDK